MQEAKFTTTPNLAFFLRYKEYSHPDLDVWYIFFLFFFYKDISLVSVYKRAGKLLEKFPQPCLQLNTLYGFYLLDRRSHCISLWIVLLLKCFQSTDGDRLPMRNPCQVNSQSHPQDRADKCALRLCVWARHPQGTEKESPQVNRTLGSSLLPVLWTLQAQLSTAGEKCVKEILWAAGSHCFHAIHYTNS